MFTSRTNELGLVTLFEQRPFWHCPKHDEYLCDHNENPMLHWCYSCIKEDNDRITAVAGRAEMVVHYYGPTEEGKGK